jgi:hypothetical protein
MSSNQYESRADDAYETVFDDQNAVKASELNDDSYTSQDSYPVKVQKDSEPVDGAMDSADADTDAALGKLEQFRTRRIITTDS